ncbi:hypothetical protein [Tepidibacter mesophilus]|uniref:hypothetical protein n=1 Tax=Tepidibacter mesophilus TaxID=655607 RepID=UPI000C07B62A|nr:hypothetical protein [Tepidibacter mesophilus]
MPYRKKHMKILYSLSIMLLFCFVLPSYAMDSNLDLEPNSLTLKDNGGNNKCQVTGNKKIKINTNTMKLEKGYYTSQFYINSKVDWSPYKELAFHINNLSDSPIKINLFVVLNDGTYIMLEEGKSVFLQKGKNNNIKVTNIQTDGFEVNNDFEGIVHIPLENFEISKKKLENIIFFGIQTTTKENIIQKMEIDNLKLISSNSSTLPEEILNLKIVGDKNIIKPIMGESIVQYELVTKHKQENKVTFYLEEEVEGVSITENGRLTVLPNAVVDKINIKAVINNKFNLILEVILSDSLILNLKDMEGFSLTIPKDYEVRKVISSQDIFSREDVIVLFRLIIALIAIIILTTYFVWRIKWKKENINQRE